MNSTGSFQPWCLKEIAVKSPARFKWNAIFVPIPFLRPSTTSHCTRLLGQELEHLHVPSRRATRSETR